MPAVKIEQIGGMLPAWDPQLLPAGQAADALNLYAFSGHMEGWRTPKLLRRLNDSAAKFVYRVPTTAQTYATAYIVFLGPNFAAGDTITVGATTYKLDSTLSSPNSLAWSSPLTLAQSLLAALTNDLGQQTNMGVLYGNGTQQNPVVGFQSSVSYAPLGYNSGGNPLYVPYVAIQAPVTGVAYNGTPCSVSSTGAGMRVLSDVSSFANVTAVFTGGSNPTLDTDITAPVSWLEFTDPDTNVVRSQVLNDVYLRYYFASPSQQPQYNTGQRIAAGLPPFLLGINPPSVAPTISVSGTNNQVLFPSYGSSNVGGAGFNAGFANQIILTPILVTQACTLTEVDFTAGNTDGTQEYAGVIYSDSNSINGGITPVAPYQLMGTGAVNTGITAGAKAASLFINPLALSGTPTSPTVYWIGIICANNIALPLASPISTQGYYTSNVFTQGAPFNAPASLSGPATTPSIWAVCTTSDVLEARGYVYTWVSAYGEESAPSPFTIGNGYTNAAWTINVTPPPLSDMGTQRNIVTCRIYRTVTSTTGATVFYWVADIPITNVTYEDILLDSVVATHIQLPSTTYFPPPGNLQGLINLHNGMVVGWVGNQVWFCVPFLPHAWPPGNVFNTDYPIVGVGFTNDALVICTEANAFVMLGTSPSTMSMDKCQSPDPCLSRGSILSTDLGVYYMSPNGLMQVTNLSQSTNVTELWVTREKWASLTPQKYARTVPISGCYFSYACEPGLSIPTFFNPADNGGITLSNNNLTVTGVNGWYAVRSTTSHNTGKLFARMLVGGTATYSGVGLCDVLTDLTPNGPYLGAANNGCSLMLENNSLICSRGPNGMNPVNGWVLGALNPGDYIDIAVDFSMGYVWLGKNGTWNAGAQPFSGLPYTAPASISKPTASFTPGTTLYLAASAYLSTDTTTLDVNYAQLASVAPSGFIPWIGPPNPPALTGSQGFALELNQDNTSFTIWPQPGGHRVGFTQLAQPNGYPVDNIITDPWTGIAMIVQNSQVWYYDFTDPAPVMQPYSYTSKVYQQNTKKSYSAMRVFLTVPPNTPPQAPQTNELPETDPSWNTLGAGQWAIVKVYADVSDTNYDGTLQLVCAREVRKSGELLRIPGGFKAERWQVEVMGRVVVSNVQLATSVKELGNV